VFRHLTNTHITLIALLLGRIFFRRTPALNWSLRDVSVTDGMTFKCR